MKKVEKYEKNRIWLVLFFAAVAVVFLTVFSLATSFLYENKFIGWDSDVFLAMGKFANEGLIPYKDFFDHKGPFIIFIEWLGYALGGRTGVFAIQAVFLTVFMLGIYKIFRLYCTGKASIVLSLVSLLVLNMYFDKGNLTEEFCLPFLAWSMYVAVGNSQYIWKGVRLDYLLYGATFMVGAMTRLTNSLPVAIIVAISVIMTVTERQWNDLWKNLLWFVVGNLVLLVPMLAYFIKVGALKEMIYATFIYNFKHGFERNMLTGIETLNMLALAVPLVVVLVVGIVARAGFVGLDSDERVIKSKAEIILCIQSGVAIIMLLISRPYPHYYMVWIPTIVLGMALMAKEINIKKMQRMALAGVMAVVMLAKLVTAGLDVYSTLTSNVCQVFDEETRQVLSRIPKKDSDKVIAYNVRSRFYLVTDILPCYKNFAFQGIHTAMDDVEREEFEKDLESMEASYIITGINDGAYSEFIEEHYELEKATTMFRLFVRK